LMDTEEQKEGEAEQEEVEMTYPELLLWAARNNEIQDLELCFEEKVEVNTVDKESGSTALHYACANAFLLAAKLLLSHGAGIRDVM